MHLDASMVDWTNVVLYEVPTIEPSKPHAKIEYCDFLPNMHNFLPLLNLHILASMSPKENIFEN